MKRFVRVLMILMLIQLFNACLFSGDDDNNDDFTKHHDSYVTLLEYHAYKQVFMHDFFQLFSDGFTNSTLFEYTPTDDELFDFFEKIETLLTYEEALNDAINVLQQKSTASYNANDYLLKSSMADWDWLLKYVPFKGKNIELRNKILSKTKSMSKDQRESLFSEVANIPAWTGNASDADDFFGKMENGDLDNSILRLHHTFKQSHQDYLKWTNDNNLGSAQMAFDYGKEALETGQKVMVTTVKNINPAVGKSIDILEKGNQFLEYINQCMSEKSFNQFANDANVQITEKYAESGLDDQGEPANQKTLSVVESAQLLTKTALVNSDPVSVVNTDFDWGGIKLNNDDESLVPDIVFAERIMGDIAPNVILCAEMLVDEVGQWVVPLPSGKWDIVAVDEKGVSDTITDWSVITQHFGVADISAPKTKDEDDEENVESAFDFKAFTFETMLTRYDATNVAYSSNSGSIIVPVKWTNNTFEVEFELDNPIANYDNSFNKKHCVLKGEIEEDASLGYIVYFSVYYYNESYYNSMAMGFRHTLEEYKIEASDVPMWGHNSADYEMYKDQYIKFVISDVDVLNNQLEEYTYTYREYNIDGSVKTESNSYDGSGYGGYLLSLKLWKL